MSGHKRATVSISQQELQRLKEASQRLNQVERDYEEIRNRIQERRENESSQFIQEVVLRQEDFQQALGSVHFDVQALEWQTSQALIDQAEQVSLCIQQAGEDLWDNTQALVFSHIQSINNLMAENQAAHQNYLNDLQSELHQMNNDRINRRELALQAINNAHGFLEAIHKSYPHQQFYPNALENLFSEVEMAGMNFENHLYEAAILGAQQASRQAALLRLSLEEHIQKINLLKNVVKDQVNFLSQSIQDRTFVDAIDFGGNKLNIRVDVNFWTDGALFDLLQKCQEIESLVNQPNQYIDYDKLLLIQQETLPQLNAQLDEIIFQARVNILASQLRLNIAEKIIEALKYQGFEIQESGYQTLDQRNPFCARLCAFDGSEVFVRVVPTSNNENLNIHIQSTDNNHYSDTESRMRAKAIFKSLQDSGLNIGNLQVARQHQFAELPKNYRTQHFERTVNSR